MTWPDPFLLFSRSEINGSRSTSSVIPFSCSALNVQGPQCNTHITFKPELKCRWAQKQKCRVFQNLQVCFRVHLQKSNSFEINMKLSKVFKLYVNPIDKTTLHIYPKGSFTYLCNLNTSFELLQNNSHTFETYRPCSPI
jgi:hypothetical protein